MTPGLETAGESTEPSNERPAAAQSRGSRLASALGIHEAGRVLRDFATYLPMQAIPAIAGFLVLPIVARMLAPTELGVLAIAQTLITLGWTVSGSWFAFSIIREYPASTERDTVGEFEATFRRGLAVTGFFFGGFVAALALAGLFSSAVRDNLLLICAAVAGLVIQNIAVSLFAAGLRPRAYAIVEVLARTGGIGLGVTLVLAGHKVQGYLLGLALGSLAVGVVGLRAAWPRGGRSGRGRDLTVWLRYGIPGGIASLTLWALFFVDRYLLAALKDTGAVGVYTVGNVIGDKTISIPTLAFFTAASPLLVTAFEQRGRPEVERLMRAYTRVMLLVSIPLLVLLAAVADDLISLLAGKRYYAAAADVVPIVAIGTLFYALGLVGTAGLITSKRTPPLIWAALIGLGVNVGANLVLIPAFGIIGAAVATPISTATYLLAVQLWARRYVTWRFPYATAARATIAGAVALGAALAAVPDGLTETLRIAVAALLIGLVYTAVLGVLGERRMSRASTSE